jgi:hypothetical protein
MQLLPLRRDEGEPGDDLMRATGEALEHLLGVLGAGRLAVHPAGVDHLGVAAEHRTSVGLWEHRPSLAQRVCDRILLCLLVPRSDEVERDPELLEDLPPPG